MLVVLGVVAVLALAVVLFVRTSVVVVRQGRAAVLERFGRYRRVAGPGVVVLVPFADRVRAQVDTREQDVVFLPMTAISRDVQMLTFEVVVHFRVTNPVDAVYGTTNYLILMQHEIVTALCDVVGSMDLSDVLSARAVINDGLSERVVTGAEMGGVLVRQVRLRSVEPPRAVLDARQAQLRTAHDRRREVPPISAAPTPDGEPIETWQRKLDKAGIRFVEVKEKENGTTYMTLACDDAEEAKGFLRKQTVTRELYYVVIETPGGNWGADISGLFLEKLLPWQYLEKPRQGEVIGTIVGDPTAVSLEYAAAAMVDNFVVELRCGICGREWLDGVRYRDTTAVRCPSCTTLNRVNSHEVVVPHSVVRHYRSLDDQSD